MSQLEALNDLADHISEELGGVISHYEFERDELVLHANPAEICSVLQFLKSDSECEFTQLISICGADYPEREPRFDVIYNLLSMTHNQRVRIKLAVEEGQLIPTVSKIFSTAGWFERETWDMYGIYFDGHEDLRRILTDYGFNGHPLRKDFPLSGHVELRYSEEEKRVVYEPVQLTQDYRDFDNMSPWEGITDIQLPGDEKGTVPKHGWEPADKTVGGAK